MWPQQVAIVSSERVGCWHSTTAMTKKAKKVPFDPKVFLATVNGGRSISNYREGKTVFSQGKPADAVFYIQSGKVKITVVSEQGKSRRRGPGAGRILRRRMPKRAAGALGDCDGNDGMRDHATGEINYDQRSP